MVIGKTFKSAKRDRTAFKTVLHFCYDAHSWTLVPQFIEF